MTYTELSNLTIDDINEDNIESLEDLVKYKRHRIMEISFCAGLCCLICSIPLFKAGFSLLGLISALLSGVECGIINIIINEINIKLNLRPELCDITKQEYSELKKSGKLEEIKQMVKEYKNTPLTSLKEIKQEQAKLQADLAKINNEINNSKKLINRVEENTRDVNNSDTYNNDID